MNSKTIHSPGESSILTDYLPMLIRLVERNMSSWLQTKVGTDEMANSVIGSVIRMARDGKLQIEQSEDFWKLLVVISLNKVRKKVRIYTTEKRDYRREVVLNDELPTLEEMAQEHGHLTDEDGVEIGKILDLVTQRLDEDCNLVLQGRIEGRSNHEIASRLGKSTRTVTRCWQTVIEELKKIWAEVEID